MRKAFIGIGNPLLSDDNIGNLVVDELASKIQDKNYLFIRAETAPENFIGKIKKFSPDEIYFIDAASFNSIPGSIRIFNISEVLNKTTGTHNISVKIFKKFFPRVNIYVIGISPEKISFGEGISSSLNISLISKKIKDLIF